MLAFMLKCDTSCCLQYGTVPHYEYAVTALCRTGIVIYGWWCAQPRSITITITVAARGGRWEWRLELQLARPQPGPGAPL